MVGLPERVRHRAALRGIAIQRAVQLVGREGIRQFLRAGPVIDPDEGVVGHGVADETAETEPTQRDCHLQLIARKGRMGWQTASGYNKRANVEAAIGRYKWVIGDGLHSRTDHRQATEVAVAVRALNRMLELGRPHYVRTA